MIPNDLQKAPNGSHIRFRDTFWVSSGQGLHHYLFATCSICVHLNKYLNIRVILFTSLAINWVGIYHISLALMTCWIELGHLMTFLLVIYIRWHSHFGRYERQHWITWQSPRYRSLLFLIMRYPLAQILNRIWGLRVRAHSATDEAPVSKILLFLPGNCSHKLFVNLLLIALSQGPNSRQRLTKMCSSRKTNFWYAMIVNNH